MPSRDEGRSDERAQGDFPGICGWDFKNRQRQTRRVNVVPMPVAPRKLVSFEESRVVCGIVAHAGLGDALEPADLDFGETDTSDMETLVAELAGLIDPENVENPKGYEASLDEVLVICRDKGLFEEKLDGRMRVVGTGDEKREVFEFSKGCRIAMGTLLKWENNKVWTIAGGKVRFGRKNSRRWPMEVVG